MGETKMGEIMNNNKILEINDLTGYKHISNIKLNKNI